MLPVNRGIVNLWNSLYCKLIFLLFFSLMQSAFFQTYQNAFGGWTKPVKCPLAWYMKSFSPMIMKSWPLDWVLSWSSLLITEFFIWKVCVVDPSKILFHSSGHVKTMNNCFPSGCGFVLSCLKQGIQTQLFILIFKKNFFSIWASGHEL